MAIALGVTREDGSTFTYHRVECVNTNVKNGYVMFAVYSYKDKAWADAQKPKGQERWYKLVQQASKDASLDNILQAAYEQISSLPEWAEGEEC